MKIFALFVVVSLAAVSVFADNKDDLVHMSHQIDALISQNAGQLSLQQTAQIYELLSHVQQTIGKPLPSLPNPPPVPTQPDFVACAADNPQTMQTAFQAIKAFAYAPDGFNYSDQDATNFALDWTQRYACSAADAYIKDGHNIRAMAYEPNGFNMSSPDAATYAKTALEHRCQSGINFEQLGENYYNFAYSTQGMNLSSPDASAYAQKQMNANYFHCTGIHR
jgi:hypothetical protein